MKTFQELTFKTDNINLNQIELNRLAAFNLFLLKNVKNTQLIFRGENFNNLKIKLNLVSDSDYTKLNQFLFLLGDKGRTYRESYRKQISNNKKVYSIDCTSNEFFIYIFEKLNKILKRKEIPQILKFASSQSVLSDYFGNLENKKDFVKKIDALQNDLEKIEVRDYYLYLLHQVGKKGFYSNSFFVSTSLDFNIARDFANGRNGVSDRIIFVSWFNNPQVISTSSLILKSNLPEYKNSFYPKQKEHLLKGGLLPHYILGYINVGKMEFEVNPHFFTTRYSFAEILKKGFEIDQSKFHEVLNLTDYKGFFILDEEENYNDLNV